MDAAEDCASARDTFGVSMHTLRGLPQTSSALHPGDAASTTGARVSRTP